MAVCSLCQRLADNVRFSLLIDVKDTDVAQWTFNIISVRRLRRLCTKCCQHICLVGDLLFKWKNLVDISMDAASAASGCEKGKPKRKSSQPPESEFNEAEPAPTVDGEIDNDDDPASLRDLDQKSPQQPISNASETPKKRGRPSKRSIDSKSPKKREGKASSSGQLDSPEMTTCQSISSLCPECGGQCVTQCLKAVETKIKTHSCRICREPFPSLYLLWQHYKAGHKNYDLADGEGRCPHCNENFKRVNRHMKLAHGMESKSIGPKDFLCRFCPKVFTKKGEVDIHERIHTKEKPYICDDCGRRFSSSHQLNLHRTLHTGEIKYKCRYCEKRFRLPGNREGHERAIHKSKQFICPKKCGKVFIRTIQLTKHLQECAFEND